MIELFILKNLYKLNGDQTPRISSCIVKALVGIKSQMLENFIEYILICFDRKPSGYLKDKVADNKLHCELQGNYTKF